MKTPTSTPTPTNQAQTVIIKPIKPLLFDFFVSNRPS